MRKQMKIENFLTECGIYGNLKGYGYLIQAVELVLKNPKLQVTKDLYPTLAKLNNDTEIRVERAMRHIVSDRLTRKQFQNVGMKQLPTTSEFIWHFASLEDEGLMLRYKNQNKLAIEKLEELKEKLYIPTEYREQGIETIDEMIEELKGAKDE